jgi:hypothetical protein
MESTRQVIRKTRSLTSRPFGVNLVLAWPQEERLAICLEEGVSIISFSFGGTYGDGNSIRRYESSYTEPGAIGQLESMCLYAGQGGIRVNK